MNIKKPLLIGAAATVVGITGLTGMSVVGAAAATNESDTVHSSIVDKLVAKFNLNKEEVQAVFDEERAARAAEMKAEFDDRLEQAVSDGKLTQEQVDHIKSVRAEIESLRGDKHPRELSDETRDAIKEKMDELRDWAEENDIDMIYVMGGHGRGMGGPGRGM